MYISGIVLFQVLFFFSNLFETNVFHFFSIVCMQIHVYNVKQ